MIDLPNLKIEDEGAHDHSTAVYPGMTSRSRYVAPSLPVTAHWEKGKGSASNTSGPLMVISRQQRRPMKSSSSRIHSTFAMISVKSWGPCMHDGQRCVSTWKIYIDEVIPFAISLHVCHDQHKTRLALARILTLSPSACEDSRHQAEPCTVIHICHDLHKGAEGVAGILVIPYQHWGD